MGIMGTQYKSYIGKKAGFTIVELLIVIVVIGILAAIVVVAFNGIQQSAVNASVRSDLTNFAKKLEAYKAEYGSYPSNATALEALDIKLNQGNYTAVDSSGNQRNNFYYVLSNSTHPDGQHKHYAVGAITKNMNAICMADSRIVAATNCSSGNNTMLLVTSDTTQMSWGPSGHSETGGWASWTQ